MEHASVANRTSTSDARSKHYRTYVLIVLTLVYAFNFIDRQIIGILSPFIKEDLGLDDAQLGWLKGIYFALLYTTVGIPIAWLADRYNRVNIIAISLTMWSGFTALSGLASNYLQLALARIGVGIGEAGGSPPSHSIISDLYPKEKRAAALSIYSLGIPFGIMIAFFASAFILKGGNADWRTVMISVGLPGIALALLLKFTVQEPPRGGSSAGQIDKEPIPFKQAIAMLLTIPSWWGMCLGISFSSFGNYAISTWVIDYYVRAFAGLDIFTLLIWMGIINGTVYALGVWLGGVLADKWSAKTPKAYGYLPAAALIVGAPAFWFALQAESLTASLVLFTVLLFTTGMNLGPSFAIAQTLAPVRVRALSTALFFFVLNLIALGGGPTFVGIVSNSLSATLGETEALRTSMSWLMVTYGLAIVAFLWTTVHIEKDWHKARHY
ncbi:MFS transporter [Aestuariibacter sp. AA17]|uniref:MFS transporter n=1 Tax=Fluctibacter corallii TaxID=2984329 RepID=A0ABT3A986_9ALTE|nr:MFS transporter [Aestuariibacter sp. AA17]MCV2885214.1 MFS transporter [Aestuariibacter sp. AA17]